MESYKTYRVLSDGWILAGKTDEAHRMRSVRVNDILRAIDLGDWILVQTVNGKHGIGYIRKNTTSEEQPL
jgi:hypothetical protein